MHRRFIILFTMIVFLWSFPLHSDSVALENSAPDSQDGKIDAGITSLDDLPLLPGLHAIHQFSSHNKKGDNGDSRWNLYEDKHGHAVIFDVEGPGCIRSMWGTDIREGAGEAEALRGKDSAFGRWGLLYQRPV